MRTVGHYRLQSLIGRGATSEVYAAEHTLLGDQVAIKLLRPELANDPGSTQALVEEGARVRNINHVNVVRVLDVGINPATQGCYLVMERVQGKPLSMHLDDAAPLPEPEVRRLGAELADGVAAAHARGIVHRDLKPANVMLHGERPKIVDFGIAKHLGARTAVTTGRMIGTLAYMAPEQLASGMIAPCTDIWALGVILFEATTGRHPFENFDDGRCPQLFDEPARARSIVPAISESLDEILARCLSRDPARRPASAEELASLLRGETALSDERITADAGPVPAPVLAATLPPRPTRLRAPTFAIGAAAAIALVVVAATRSSSDAPQAAPIAEPAPVIVDAAVAIADEPSLDAAPIEIELAKVEVRSKPTGAEVLVGGKSRGVTPLTIEIALPDTVVVQRAGYHPTRTRVERPSIIDVTLQRARKHIRHTHDPSDKKDQKETLD